jgi:hypothetical protein
VFAWREHLRTAPRDLAWAAPPTEDHGTVSKTTDELIGLPITRRAKFDRKPGHAFPMDADTFAKWQAKYGRRAEAKLRQEAQRARYTKNMRFLDNQSDFMTRRSAPELERQVRAVLAADKIELTSWYDPEKREWFRLWEQVPTRIPPMRNLSRERAKAAGYRDESEAGMAEARNLRKQLGDATEGQVRTIYTNRWDDLTGENQQKILGQQYNAMLALMNTLDWHDDLLVAQLSLMDSLLRGYERLMYSKARALDLARHELSELMRANDDTEIPLEMLDRKEGRIEGLQTQLVAFQGLFAQGMRLRRELVEASPIEWSAYRSIEQRATDNSSKDKRRRGQLARLQGATPEYYAEWQESVAYVPHWDGADADPTE